MACRLCGRFTNGLLDRVTTLLEIIVALFKTMPDVINIQILTLQNVFFLVKAFINQNHQQQHRQNNRC